MSAGQLDLDQLGSYATTVRLRLGISIERIKPGHPQQNGRQERMHLTLKKEATRPVRPFSGRTGLLHCSDWHHYSITSSAKASSDGGTLRPSAFAVLRLITKPNLFDSTTGRSAGFRP